MARNKHPEETRNLIIDTAVKLFLEKGYDHTSVQDIINHLGGLSKGAIYHHFKSKEDIMLAVADRLYSTSEEEALEVCKRKDLNGKEKLKELFHTSVRNPGQKDMFRTAPDMLLNPQLLALFLRDNVQKEATEMILKVMEEGIADGSIQTEYPRQLAEVLLLVSNIWMNPMVYHCDPAEMVKRVKFFQYMMKQFNLDIIEEDMIESLEEYTDIYQRQTKTQE